MPGTRNEEFRKNLPIMLEACRKIKSFTKADFILITPNFQGKSDFLTGYEDLNIKFADSSLNNYEHIFNSDFVITKFGTSNLECGLLKTPFCAVYKTGFINYYLAKLLFKLKYVSLVNILLNKPVVKEFIQSDFTKENIANEVLKILNDEDYRIKMLKNFDELVLLFEDNKSYTDPIKLITDEIRNA